MPGAKLQFARHTLKREEIYVNNYNDLEHLRANIEEFIEQYYNRLRLHSALGYRPPEEFGQQIEASGPAESRSATMVFFENKENSGKISQWESAGPYTVLLAPGGAKLYEKLGPLDILELRRKVLENLPSDNIGFNKYWANE